MQTKTLTYPLFTLSEEQFKLGMLFKELETKDKYKSNYSDNVAETLPWQFQLIHSLVYCNKTQQEIGRNQLTA